MSASDLWSEHLTEKQLLMLIACKGDGTQLGNSIGLELRGAQMGTALALERKGLGEIDGIGGSLAPMFWANGEGLRILHEFAPEIEGEFCPCCGARADAIAP